MVTYLIYYWIGFYFTFLSLALLNINKSEQDSISANVAVVSALFWPLVLPFAIIGAIHGMLKVVFEKISKS